MIAGENRFLERRAHPRIETKEGIYVRYTSYSTRIGEVKEMSLGGLSFLYAASAYEVGDPSELDLFSDVGDSFLGRLPFETVSDSKVKPDHSAIVDSLRRCGIKFVSLTSKQLASLKEFIVDSAADPKPLIFLYEKRGGGIRWEP